LREICRELLRGKVARRFDEQPSHLAVSVDFATVFVPAMDDPMPLGRHARLPLREIKLRTSRSSGPGGQHANVTASRVEASFDVAGSTALSDAQKRRVIARCGPRVTAVAQDARSQSRNRELALERLQRRLTSALATPRQRHATRPTQASVRRRLDSKRRQSERKRARKRPGGED
jgi:ribosome-associated protein